MHWMSTIILGSFTNNWEMVIVNLKVIFFVIIDIKLLSYVLLHHAVF